MTIKTARKIDIAFEAIADHLQNIEYAKSDKSINQTVNKINDARKAIRAEVFPRPVCTCESIGETCPVCTPR